MGVYLNPGVANFKQDLTAEIYVDKTLMIREMNKLLDGQNKYVCVSRPRRFGKTIAGCMLAAYYSKGADSGDTFILLCDEYDMDFAECKRWYNGYSMNGLEIYNPRSVVMSVKHRLLDSFWGKTSSYEVISDRIDANFAGTREAVVRMLAGESVSVNVSTYLNTMKSFFTLDDAFTYLIHVGYLAYDAETKTCRIPNREIWQEWTNAIRVDKNYKKTNEIIGASEKLSSASITTTRISFILAGLSGL